MACNIKATSFLRWACYVLRDSIPTRLWLTTETSIWLLPKNESFVFNGYTFVSFMCSCMRLLMKALIFFSEEMTVFDCGVLRLLHHLPSGLFFSVASEKRWLSRQIKWRIASPNTQRHIGSMSDWSYGALNFGRTMFSNKKKTTVISGLDYWIGKTVGDDVISS